MTTRFLILGLVLAMPAQAQHGYSRRQNDALWQGGVTVGL